MPLVKLVPMKWCAPVPRLSDAHVDHIVSLAQLKFEIHDLNEVIVVAPTKAFQNEGAEIAAVPNLVAAFFKVFAIDIEDAVVEGVRRTVMFDREA
jgi:hypothetical protein